MPTPLVTPLPALDRTAPDFREDVDLFFASQVPTFTVQVNTLADYLVVKSDSAASSATAAAGSATSAANSATAATTNGAAQVALATTQANNAAASASSAATSRDQAQSAAAAAGAAAGLPALIGHAGEVLTVSNDETGVLFASAVPKFFRIARTSNTILSADDRSKWIDYTGTFTQTFASVSVLGNGWYAYVRNVGSGTITLDPSGSETIDGLATLALYPGHTRIIQCDGSSLRTIIISGEEVTNVVDQKTSGTSGGNGVIGNNIRTLNTVRSNSISGASLASNAVTLPAGIYQISASAPGFKCVAHQVRIVNAANSAILLEGTTERSGDSDNTQTRSFVSGQLVLSSATSIRVDQEMSGSNTGSLGAPAGFTRPEIYTELLIRKVA